MSAAATPVTLDVLNAALQNAQIELTPGAP
jgi:hypothetical protein